MDPLVQKVLLSGKAKLNLAGFRALEPDDTGMVERHVT
jgi:hypothetical protein